MSRSLERSVPRLHGTLHGPEHIVALVFLHELASDANPHCAPPREARWDRLCTRPDDELPAALDRACAACTRVWGEALDGFFDDVAFTTLSPAEARGAHVDVGRFLARLDGVVSSGTRLADIYQFTRTLSTKQWQGAFFTPSQVTRAMAMMLEIAPGEWVCDPACGGGAMLTAALDEVRRAHGSRAASTVTLIGVEIDARTAAIARASLILAGAHPDQFWIGVGDSLAQPVVGRSREDGELTPLKFTAILANPPFGMKVSMQALERAAERGPLVIPDRVLYRRVLKLPAAA